MRNSVGDIGLHEVPTKHSDDGKGFTWACSILSMAAVFSRVFYSGFEHLHVSFGDLPHIWDVTIYFGPRDRKRRRRETKDAERSAQVHGQLRRRHDDSWGNWWPEKKLKCHFVLLWNLMFALVYPSLLVLWKVTLRYASLRYVKFSNIALYCYVMLCYARLLRHVMLCYAM